MQLSQTQATIDVERYYHQGYLTAPAIFSTDQLARLRRPDTPRLFQQAHAQGLTTSLDTNYDPAGTWNGGLADLFPYVDIFLPNETELFAITGLSDLESALAAMTERVNLVAVKLGARGAVARRRDDAQLIWADALAVPVVDTTGAGDTFDAGLIYGHQAGWDLARSLRLGCVCGSLSASAAGGIIAQPTLAEALEKV